MGTATTLHTDIRPDITSEKVPGRLKMTCRLWDLNPRSLELDPDSSALDRSAKSTLW